MLQRCSPLLHSRVVVFSESPTRFPASIVRRPEKTAASSSIVLANRDEASEPQTTELSKFMMGYSSAPLIESGRQLRIRPTPELGLLSLLFALSMAVGSIICLAIISIPTMTAISRLIASMDLLSKVISKEIPGTLSSLRLSSLEIKDLTQKLGNLRQLISGINLSEEKERKQ